jgi:Zn-dependent M28 family amino/carboxypeptidase
MIFLSVNGEEAGLLGSDYFAHYPTVPKSAIVADVNMDLVDFLWPLQDIVAMGIEHSSLSSVAERAAAKLHLSLSPDPSPEQVFFIRSDQYSFVKQGIPSVYPNPGVKSSDPKISPLKIRQDWEQTRYHQPQDDMNQPGLLFNEAAKFAQYTFLVGYYIAQEPQRPAWNRGDFFGDRYGQK